MVKLLLDNYDESTLEDVMTLIRYRILSCGDQHMYLGLTRHCVLRLFFRQASLKNHGALQLAVFLLSNNTIKMVPSSHFLEESTLLYTLIAKELAKGPASLEDVSEKRFLSEKSKQ